MRRTSTSSFVPDAWVFPGGAVDRTDRLLAERHLGGTDLDVMRVTALRELFEETGIWLGEVLDDPEGTRDRVLDDPSVFLALFDACASQLDRLVWTSRWVTPIGVPKRFDTYFFLLPIDSSHEASPEHREGVELRWLTPSDALRLHGAGSFSMVFPTIRNLEAIAGAASISALLESRRNVDIPITQPTLIVEGGRKRIVLPEDPQ